MGRTVWIGSVRQVSSACFIGGGDRQSGERRNSARRHKRRQKDPRLVAKPPAPCIPSPPELSRASNLRSAAICSTLTLGPKIASCAPSSSRSRQRRIPGDAVLHLVQAAEDHEVEDAFLEAAAAKALACLEELGSRAGITADGAGHLLHSRAGGFAEGGNVVDRAERRLPIRRDSARSHQWVAPAERVGARSHHPAEPAGASRPAALPVP